MIEDYLVILTNRRSTWVSLETYPRCPFVLSRINRLKSKLIKFFFNTLTHNFSLQYHPWIKQERHESKENDHQQKKLLIVTQILLVSTTGSV